MAASSLGEIVQIMGKTVKRIFRPHGTWGYLTLGRHHVRLIGQLSENYL